MTALFVFFAAIEAFDAVVLFPNLRFGGVLYPWPWPVYAAAACLWAFFAAYTWRQPS
jgi:hypothetical protein